MKKTLSFAVAPLLLAWGCASAEVTLNRADALDNPSRHAWNLFLMLNHPAKDVKQGRGQPDLTKKFGASGTTTVWETWRLARTEVFLPQGKPPPKDFNDLSFPGGNMAKVPEPTKAQLLKEAAATPPVPGALKPLFDPVDGVFDCAGGFGETRMNKSTYDFIVQNGLYSLEGQSRFAADYVAGKKPNLSFPVDSIEVKAAWVQFDDAELAANKDKTFYSIRHDGKVYGLAALHIITKDLPNWFWATFHHVSNPENRWGGKDTVGQPKEVKGTVWENYKLGGPQVDFVEPNGRPTLMSDHYVEFGFQRSSCISCHARATASPNMDQIQRLGSKVVLGSPDYREYFKPIDPAKFEDAEPLLMQTDFLWSLPFRARSEKEPPQLQSLIVDGCKK
jgi:hypothetical protein